MIGNDIVDLKQATKDSNWKRPRFLDKVFTVEEQQLITEVEEQHQQVWLLWSMKEAAYKVHVQQFGKRFFNPKKLVCDLITLEKGSVTIDTETYFTQSTITEDYVYTVATLEFSKTFKSECFQIKNSNYKAQSINLRQRFFEFLPMETSSLKIRKNKVGVPQLVQKNTSLNLSFSLTHHGRFSGYAYL